jgi:hypothetical protein
MKPCFALALLAFALFLPLSSEAQSTTNEFSIRFRLNTPPPDVDVQRVYAGKTIGDWTHVKEFGRTNEVPVILPSGGTWHFTFTYQTTNKVEGKFSDVLTYTYGSAFPPSPSNVVVLGASIQQISTWTNLITLRP